MMNCTRLLKLLAIVALGVLGGSIAVLAHPTPCMRESAFDRACDACANPRPKCLVYKNKKAECEYQAPMVRQQERTSKSGKYKCEKLTAPDDQYDCLPEKNADGDDLVQECCQESTCNWVPAGGGNGWCLSGTIVTTYANPKFNKACKTADDEVKPPEL
jgi:hypothetical protein